MGILDVFKRMLGGANPTVSADTLPGDPAPAPPADVDGKGFPYPLHTVQGALALETWERLRRDGRGWPVVLGGDEDLRSIIEGLEEIDSRAPEVILDAARDLTFPGSLSDKRREDEQRAREWLKEHGESDFGDEETAPPIGEWPEVAGGLGLTVATDIRTGGPLDRVHIALLPCSAGWEAVAFLRWGNWNENPSAEYHVAALRSWNERYGAELVGLSRDVMNLHVATRPVTRETALALAREQYLYCSDVVDQGTETLAALAAGLMADDWWYFWWD